MESIKQVLMRRDNLSSQDADILISEAREVLNEYIENDDMDSAYNICQEYFGLGPDYLDEIMPI